VHARLVDDDVGVGEERRRHLPGIAQPLERGHVDREERRHDIEDIAHRVAMAVDNARLHEAERRARAEAEAANQAKSDFLAIMSHELRTPLTAVVGYTELLADEVVGPVNDTQRDHLSRVRASSEHLLMLIEDILSYARIEAGRELVRIEDFGLAALLEQASVIIRPLAEKKSLEFSLAGGHGEGGGAGYLTVGLWIGASAVAALVSVQLLSSRIGAAPAYGVAAGLLFAAGDISTKAAVEAADSHLAFVAALIAAYAFGTLVLQAGFQRGSALTTAGIATLLTNALPIVAGMTIFGEPLPHGWLGAVRIAAFACVVVGAVFLGEKRHPTGAGDAPEPSRRPPAPGKPSAEAESRGSA